MTEIVVYIDDEEDLCDVFSLRFERHGAKIECFSNPIEGVAFINSNDVAVVFSDYRMPKMNGIDVLNAIEKEIPFYIITGELVPEDAAPAPKAESCFLAPLIVI